MGCVKCVCGTSEFLEDAELGGAGAPDPVAAHIVSRPESEAPTQASLTPLCLVAWRSLSASCPLPPPPRLPGHLGAAL